MHDALLSAFELETDIKWPNDIMAGERKLCGILAETTDTRIGRAAILGIGINLTTASFPPELSQVATSIKDATGRSPDANVLLQALCQALRIRYRLFQQANGVLQLIDEWTRRSTYAQEKSVRVTTINEVFDVPRVALKATVLYV